jgi:hypothetical protein
MGKLFKAGEWVQYKDQFAYVHGAEKGGRHLIEFESKENPQYIKREWVKPSSITKLDPSISSLLSSIHFN